MIDIKMNGFSVRGTGRVLGKGNDTDNWGKLRPINRTEKHLVGKIFT
ncbi:hypothetical protein [Xenorhabdus siamensis]